jgi:hypothetical protein
MHLGATGNPAVGPNSQVAEPTRPGARASAVGRTVVRRRANQCRRRSNPSFRTRRSRT